MARCVIPWETSRGLDLDDPLNRWTMRHQSKRLLPSPPGSLRDLAFGHQLYVAVGGRSIAKTPDPETAAWSVRKTERVLAAVAFAERLFVAVGERGTILTSENGSDWSSQESNTASSLNEVAHGSGLIVAVGESGSIVTSPDGTNWRYRQSPIEASLRAVTHGNGRFLAWGIHGIEQVLASSSNGTDWTTSKVAIGPRLWALAYGAGLFVAVGESGAIFTSPDTERWTPQASTTAFGLTDVIWAEEAFYAVGAGWDSDAGRPMSIVLRSNDGLAWTKVAAGQAPLRSIVRGGDRLVAAGPGHFIGTTIHSLDSVMISHDGMAWRQVIDAPALQAIVFGKGQFVAVGESGRILTSADGRAWVHRLSGTPHDLKSIACDGRGYITVGNQGVILHSPDGIVWSARESGTTLDLHQVIYANNRFAAVGGAHVLFSSIIGGGYAEHVVLTSSDGETWRKHQTQPAGYTLDGIAFGNGGFVAVGGAEPGGRSQIRFIAASPDGTSWAGSAHHGSAWLKGLAFGNNTFLATGESGDFISSDGADWRQGASHPSNYSFAVAHAGGLFFRFGRNGMLRTSEDGTHWISRGTVATNSLHAAAFGHGTFIVVGAEEQILQSEPAPRSDSPLLAKPVHMDGVFKVAVQTVVGKRYALHFKRRLEDVEWTSLGSVAGHGGMIWLTDPISMEAMRFYRLQVE